MNHDVAAAWSNSCSGEEFGSRLVTEHQRKSIAVFWFIRKPVYCLGFINWIRLAVRGQKNCDSHQMWPHPKINNNILLSTLKHQNFARLLLHRSANFFRFGKLMVKIFSSSNSTLTTDWGNRNFQLSIPAGYSLYQAILLIFFIIKGQYLNAQKDCHTKRMEQGPCTYPMPIPISLVLLMDC